jgi:hypothetical protein
VGVTNRLYTKHAPVIEWAWFMQDLTTKILSAKFVSEQNLAKQRNI